MNISSPTNVWTSQQLAVAKFLGNYSFITKEESSWDEQRMFISKAIQSLKTLPLADRIKQAMEKLMAPAPTHFQIIMEGYEKIPPSEFSKPWNIGDFTIQFNISTGAITRLSQLITIDTKNGTREWASAKQPVARFMYKSHSYQEANIYAQTYNYNHEGQYPYNEPVGVPDTGMNQTRTVAQVYIYIYIYIYNMCMCVCIYIYRIIKCKGHIYHHTYLLFFYL